MRADALMQGLVRIASAFCERKEEEEEGDQGARVQSFPAFREAKNEEAKGKVDAASHILLPRRMVRWKEVLFNVRAFEGTFFYPRLLNACSWL